MTGPALVRAQSDIPGRSFEEVLSLRSVGSPVISPDGKAVAFPVSTTDWAENRYDTEIWLVREGEAPFQLTRTQEGNSSGLAWSPDGQWISFLADRGDKQQVFVIRPNGGEAQAITDVDEGIGTYHWSPDSKRIGFTSSEPESEAKKDRTERFGAFEEEDAEFNNAHLWVVDVVTDLWPSPAEAPCSVQNDEETNSEERNGESTPKNCVSFPEPERLTEGDFHVSGFAWSPDGARIAVERTENALLLSFVTADIWILEVDSGEMQPLVSFPGADQNPTWSPDGSTILYNTAAGNTTSYFYVNNQIARIPVTGGTAVRLAANIDEDVGNVRWNPQGIFLLARHGTLRHLYRVDPETGQASLFGARPDRILSADFSSDGTRMSFSAQEDTSLNEIYKTDTNMYNPLAVTNMTSQIKDWDVGTSEVISWTSYDGTEIEGVLHKPPHYDAGKQYPLLVVIHGGPTGIDYPTPVLTYVYPTTQWLAKGALVLRPNYRGSAGYGEAFRSLNVRNLGVGDTWDVLSGVDYLIGEGIVDSTRMGAMGWSQGGYISAFLTTYTDRFKAISVGAGISNWMTYYVNTDIHPFTRQYLQATPWDDPDIYVLTSPMTNINRAATPTLIQHGEFDRRVPIPNAYELYQGLQDVGVETKLIVYKNFGHGISKPKERLAAVWHNWQWFARYIWGEEVTLPGSAENQEPDDSGSE